MADPQMIHESMEQTRRDMADKLETLEKKVAGTVESVTESIGETVEKVTDTVEKTVETVSEAVESVTETVEAVTETVQGTVASVKEGIADAFDIPAHVRNHPCLMFGGSMLLGFLGGRLLGGSTSEQVDMSRMAQAGNGARTAGGARHRPNGHKGHHPRMTAPAPEAGRPTEEKEEEPGWIGHMADRFGSELTTLKELALGTLVGVLRDMTVRALPESLKGEVTKFMNDLTGTLGGKVIQEPVIEEKQGVS